MTITLSKAQRDALDALPAGADVRTRATALGWRGRPLTAAEWQILEPAPVAPSRTDALHQANPGLVDLWAALEAARLRVDACTSRWEAAVVAVRQRERDELDPQPWMPGLVNLVPNSLRPITTGLDRLKATEAEALRDRARAGEDYTAARDQYHRAVVQASLQTL